MSGNPFTKYLDRETSKSVTREQYGPLIDLIRDIVDYGTFMVPMCLMSSKKSKTDIIIIGVFFNQFMTLLDAVHCLVENGALKASFVQIRSLYEAALGIEWLLKEDTEKRAYDYYVSELRYERLWALRGLKDSAEYDAFEFVREALHDGIEGKLEAVSADTQQKLKMIDEELNKPEHKEINEEFEKLRGKSINDPKWFALSLPGGKRNPSIYDLATALGREAEYRTWYHFLSKAVHGPDMRFFMLLAEPSEANIGNIRNVDAFILAEVYMYIIPIVGLTYKRVLKRFRSGQIGNLMSKVRSEWYPAWEILKKRMVDSTS